MRGISIETLVRLRSEPHQNTETVRTLDWLINAHCKELQEPWMTLEEFLKSGFEGQCWLYSVYKDIFVVQFIDDNFISINTRAKAQLKYIEKIMPIHKPEPPR